MFVNCRRRFHRGPPGVRKALYSGIMSESSTKAATGSTGSVRQWCLRFGEFILFIILDAIPYGGLAALALGLIFQQKILIWFGLIIIAIYLVAVIVSSLALAGTAIGFAARTIRGWSKATPSERAMCAVLITGGTILVGVAIAFLLLVN